MFYFTVLNEKGESSSFYKKTIDNLIIFFMTE